MKAFPFVLNDGSDEYCSGMELRDYFAAKAITGLLNPSEGFKWSMEVYAKQAYLFADAMMEARNGK